MRYLDTSRFTEPTSLRLLDVAYIVTIAPLILVIKAPMLIYLIVVFLMLFFRKEITSSVLIYTAFLGLFALFLSMYGAFNFSGLSKLKIFIELLIYILLIAVSLQRLTRVINLYLSISPIFILALSLFFFHSVVMLGYVVFEVFMLLWLILAHRMRGSLRENLRVTSMLFTLSLPWVVLLFIFFPRISFEHASYGFTNDIEGRLGHDGTMFLDNKALLVPSDRIAMEVSFGGAMPSSNHLYFRGSTLYYIKGNHWEPISTIVKRKSIPLKNIDDIISYKITLYPTNKRWLYLLDMPIEAPSGAKLDSDFVTTVDKPISDILHYEASSALRYSYERGVDPITLRASVSYPKSQNPKSLRIAHKLKRDYPKPSDRFQKIVELFKEQHLTYSLKPKPLDMNNSVDSFLFDKRSGYCVHFASAFVLMSRMSGIPARVVTGYKATPSNSIKNYLIIKERDAHAWAELLIDGRWVRYETTSSAYMMDDATSRLISSASTQGEKVGFYAKADLYLMYLKYQVETWILQYSHFRQMQLLEHAKKDPKFVWKFVLAILSFLLFVYLLFIYFRRNVCEDSLLCIVSPLIDKLQKDGYIRSESETIREFFYKIVLQEPRYQKLESIYSLYEKIRYGGDDSNESLDMLDREIKELIRTKISKQ